MKRLVYRPDAATDIEEAFRWYEGQRAGLGAEFLLALTQAEAAVLASPLAFGVLRRDARRYLMRRFPYQLLYRVLGDDIVVVACFHARRSPRALTRRRR